jgi:uncharacterized membrane protein
MELQSVFYIVAIIFMIMWVVALTLACVVLWELYTVIKNAPQRIQAAIDSKITEVVENAKSGIMGTLGVSAASFFLNKVKRIFSKA